MCNDSHSQLKGSPATVTFLLLCDRQPAFQPDGLDRKPGRPALRLTLSSLPLPCERAPYLSVLSTDQADAAWSLNLNSPVSIDRKPAAGEGTQYTAHTPQRAHHLMDDAEQAARRQRSRRSNFIKWLRKVHGWVGLWGAVLGLLFGMTGFLLNHRAGPLKVSTGEPLVEEMQIAVPEKPLHSPMEMVKWLKGELQIDGKPGRVRREPAHPVAWGDRSAMQPEFWQVGITGPTQNVQAEYWVGNGFVAVKRTHNTFLATMNNLHKGVGLSVGWVLLIDTIAGSLILLSLTGVLLWTELNKRRVVGVVLVGGSIVATVVCALM
jgi:hypothetical protein